MKLQKILWIVLLFSTCSFGLIAGDLTIEVYEAEGELKARAVPEGGLDLGTLNEGGKALGKIVVKNNSRSKIVFDEWRSPCAGIVLSKAPEALASGAAGEITLSLDPDGYSGEFEKVMNISGKAGESKDFDLSLPIRFNVVDSVPASEIVKDKPKEIPQERMKFIDYAGGGLEKHPEAAAWIFAGKGCPGCNFLKHEIMPRLLDKSGIEKAEIIMVDLDVKDYFIFMAGLEEKLGAKKSDKTPILYWEGKFYYGNDAVKELIDSK